MMCKLCGKRSQPLKMLCHSRNPRSELSSQFCNIVYEYTNHYPCYSCNALYLQSFNVYKSDIDEYIVAKLFSRCKPSNITARTYHKQMHILRMFKSQGYKQPSFNKPTTAIEKNILHNGVSFVVQVSKKSKRYLKSFKALEEAQQFKQEVLNGNYTHTT